VEPATQMQESLAKLTFSSIPELVHRSIEAVVCHA
jgi:hypothetical protein